MTLPALPEPTAVTPATLAAHGDAIVAWAESHTDIGDVYDAWDYEENQA